MSGRGILIDDAYLGGERSGGKVVRGSENKFLFVAAVLLTEEAHPLRVKPTPVMSFTFQALEAWAGLHLVPGCSVASDGVACFTAVTTAGCTRATTAVGGRKPKDLPEFQWINAVLGNLKTSLSGTYHAFRFSKYAARYLGAFAYRFNRRLDLAALPQRLLIAVVHCRPRTEPARRRAELSC